VLGLERAANTPMATVHWLLSLSGSDLGNDYRTGLHKSFLMAGTWWERLTE